jgi:ribosomal protein S18 acetylase RimI-like enzyme
MGVETMLTGPIIVRDATAEDIPFMRAMIWEAMLASPTFLALHGVENLQQYEEDYWSRWTERPDPAFVAIDAGGRRLGGITVKPNDQAEPVGGWRIGIGVEAHARGQRVGQHLLERAIAFASDKGAEYINLFVDATNTAAIALYRRTGFVVVREEDNLIEMRILFGETT